MEAVAREVFRTYNYHEIRTPILEETELFARGVGEETDIVSKEMYTFEDRDGSSLTLRPEATASVMRAYIEHRLDQKPGLQKLYYIGPMFRRERPQKGRYRQFFQIGAEAIGSESPVVDAEVIEMVVEMLQRAGLNGFQAADQFGGRCRTAGRSTSSCCRRSLRDVAPKLCGDCQRRAETNPLRVLDCKVPEDQPIIDALPSILDHLVRAVPRALRRGARVSGRPRHRVRSAAADGARAGLLHAHDVRNRARRAGRAELRARRRPLRRPGGSARLEGACAGHWIFDRRRPAGDERRRGASGSAPQPASTCFIAPLGDAARAALPAHSRANCGGAGSRWNVGWMAS